MSTNSNKSTIPATHPPSDHTISFSGEKLKQNGYTEAAVKEYFGRLSVAGKQLHDRAYELARMEAPKDGPVNVTNQHVRQAWYSLFGALGAVIHSKWFTVSQILEYIAVGIAGAGASYLHMPLGIGAFGLGLFMAAILAVSRISMQNSY